MLALGAGVQKEDLVRTFIEFVQDWWRISMRDLSLSETMAISAQLWVAAVGERALYAGVT